MTKQPADFVDVLGVRIDRMNRASAVEAVARKVADSTGGYVCVTGVHGIAEAQRSDAFRAVQNASALTVPDGMPMVWAGRAVGFGDMRRVAGADLVLDLAARAALEQWRVFIYGGPPGRAEELGRALRGHAPQLKVVGAWSPPYRPETQAEARALASTVRELAPHLVLVGLSTPKQEFWMSRNEQNLAPSVLVGVGAAFDFLTGHVARAPRWLQRTGLEWLYRIRVEPRRLGPRYARSIPLFIWQILKRPPRAVHAVRLMNEA